MNSYTYAEVVDHIERTHGGKTAKVFRVRVSEDDTKRYELSIRDNESRTDIGVKPSGGGRFVSVFDNGLVITTADIIKGWCSIPE